MGGVRGAGYKGGKGPMPWPRCAEGDVECGFCGGAAPFQYPDVHLDLRSLVAIISSYIQVEIIATLSRQRLVQLNFASVLVDAEILRSIHVDSGLDSVFDRVVVFVSGSNRDDATTNWFILLYKPFPFEIEDRWCVVTGESQNLKKAERDYNAEMESAYL